MSILSLQNKHCDNIFIIGNPSQYIYVEEAIHHFGLVKQRNILFISSFHKGYINQILNFCENSNWTFIIKFPRFVLFLWEFSRITRPLSFLLAQIFIFSVSLGKKINCTSFIANIEDSWMSFIIKCFRYNKIIALDDGNASINIFEKVNRMEANATFLPNINRKKVFVTNSFLGIKISDLVFFSIYNDYYDTIPQLKIIPNTLEFLKKNRKNSDLDYNQVYIIGSPFVKLHMLSEAEYHSTLKTIVNNYKDFVVSYIKHRAEDDFLIENMKIISLNIPVEVFLLNSNILPNRIVTFYSSAAVTLHKLFGTDIYINNIDLFHSNNAVNKYFKYIASDYFVV